MSGVPSAFLGPLLTLATLFSLKRLSGVPSAFNFALLVVVTTVFFVKGLTVAAVEPAGFVSGFGATVMLLAVVFVAALVPVIGSGFACVIIVIITMAQSAENTFFIEFCFNCTKCISDADELRIKIC